MQCLSLAPPGSEPFHVRGNKLNTTQQPLGNLDKTTEAVMSNRLRQHSKALEDRFEKVQMDRADALMAAQSLQRQLKSAKLSSRVQIDNLTSRSRAQRVQMSEMEQKIYDLNERVRLFNFLLACAINQFSRSNAVCACDGTMIAGHAAWRARTRTPSPERDATSVAAESSGHYREC